MAKKGGSRKYGKKASEKVEKVKPPGLNGKTRPTRGAPNAASALGCE